MTPKRSRAIYFPNPESIPSGSYRVISCLFVAKNSGFLIPAKAKSAG